jgi:hypothetical protein
MSDSVDHQWLEVACQRTATTSQFSAGIQDYVFSVQAPNVFFPSKSYMRFELAVTGPGAAVPNVSNQIALAEGCIANMYNNAIFQAGGQAVSQVMNFFPQCSAIEARTSYSGAWLDKIGAYTQSYNGDRSSRIAAISSTLNAAQVRIPLAEGKSEIYRPTDGKTPDTASVAVVAATGVVTGIATKFQLSDIGSTIVINGVAFQVLVATDAGPLAITLGTKPTADIVATTNWYMCRRNLNYSTQARNTIQVLWRPSALGIFRYGGPLGHGAYRLQLSPDPNYNMTAIEYPYSTTTGYGPLTAGVYAISVVDVKLYIAIAKMSIPDGPEILRLNEFQCQSKQMTSANQNFQWTVPASTRRLYMFLQDTSAGSNPIIPPSVFRVYGSTAVAANVPLSTGEEQNLTAIQITYANITKPQTRWDSSFSSTTNYLVQLYMQSLIETKMDEDVGGAETMDQWLQRGPLYCWSFERDSSDMSTEVQTQSTYTNANWQTANLFLCAEYTRATEITSSKGQIVNVRGLNV